MARHPGWFARALDAHGVSGPSRSNPVTERPSFSPGVDGQHGFQAIFTTDQTVLPKLMQPTALPAQTHVRCNASELEFDAIGSVRARKRTREGVKASRTGRRRVQVAAPARGRVRNTDALPGSTARRRPRARRKGSSRHLAKGEVRRRVGTGQMVETMSCRENANESGSEGPFHAAESRGNDRPTAASAAQDASVCVCARRSARECACARVCASTC